MKFFAILTVLILIASLAGVGWLYMTANVVVEATGVTALEASAQPELFEQLRTQMRLGAVVGTPFIAQGELTNAEDYQFLTYTIRLRNDCYVPADMVELQISPMAGDVLQIGSSVSAALPARGTADATATLLTDVNMHSIREVVVTYYMWGVPFTVKTTVR
ncbi:MAG: hypothetical protein IJZ74_03075 [Clostridia bacterium]|nr:hypothetical protein [Clostridia bacterium]